jgi:DNA-binding transcriptional regulator LsrR (DeoR family)
MLPDSAELRALRLRFTTEGPDEAARKLGVSTRKARRLVERAMDDCAFRLEVEGRFRPCLDRHASVIAYVAGTAPDLDETMEEHLADCFACALAAELLERAARQEAGRELKPTDAAAAQPAPSPPATPRSTTEA